MTNTLNLKKPVEIDPIGEQLAIFDTIACELQFLRRNIDAMLLHGEDCSKEYKQVLIARSVEDEA
jgi:hypothetical protein